MYFGTVKSSTPNAVFMRGVEGEPPTPPASSTIAGGIVLSNLLGVAIVLGPVPRFQTTCSTRERSPAATSNVSARVAICFGLSLSRTGMKR
jgi:hypothetical protein